MCEILLFGGTTEGRLLAEFCHRQKIPVTVSVVTEYGKKLLPESPYVKVLAARMDREEMERYLLAGRVELVVDATHPYALLASANIKEACEAAGVRRIRCGRELSDNAEESGVTIVGSEKEAAFFLENREGNVLLTTGSKELSAFTRLKDFKERVYARVLPSADVIVSCERLGFGAGHLICMQGPFSEEMNVAVLHQTKAAYMVTKETGRAGGFGEKLEAAKKCGVASIVIRHENETDCRDIKDVCGILKEYQKTESARLPAKCRKTAAARESVGYDGDFKVILAGAGPGSPGQMTSDVIDAVRTADVLFGASRVLESAAQVLNGRKARCISRYMPADVAEGLKCCRQRGEKRAVVLFSGDTGFYSGMKKTAELLTQNGISFSVLPGVSSVAYLAARLNTSWEDAAFFSAHGRAFDPFPVLERGQEKMFLLLSGENGAGKLCGQLSDRGFGHYTVSVGENLSYPEERILTGSAAALRETVFGPLCLVLIEKGMTDER